jgi:cold shock CspA family protein
VQIESGDGAGEIVFVANDALMTTGRRYLVEGERVQFKLAQKRGAGKRNKGMLRAVQVQGEGGNDLTCAMGS